ncbi:MAG TPA: N-acetyltransferase [Bryobacteraceae bacterium]|jgi:amino-acid N-acetyltransferase|nr:N-acetyltransferase [Bryobacteraceae bacterium]
MISALTPDSVIESAAAGLPLEVRKAGMADIEPLLGLINGYAAKGIMLPRTEFEMSENIRDFSVIYDGAQLIACGALHFYSPIMGEVRSLAVDPNWKSHGAGGRMVQALVEEARLFSLDAVFAFTYVADFFRKMGFHEVERGELPLKAWKDCLRCPKFQCCDEIAMVQILRPDHWRSRHRDADDGESVLFPIVNLVTSKP